MVDLTKIKTASTWPETRKSLLDSLVKLIGPVRHDPLDLQTKTVDEMEFRGYSRRRINYFVDSWDRISAWLFIPEGRDEMPAILCCHSMVPQGKDEQAGLEGDPRFAFAQRYAEMGYITIAPDCFAAGDRVPSRKKPYDTAGFYKENPKGSLAAKMLNDHFRAIDAISEMKRVDAARIGVIGHGLGGFNALMLAAFDERVQVCVASSAFTRFATDKEPQRWFDEEQINLLPKLAAAIENKNLDIDWEHILSLAAPTAALVVSSLSDTMYSNPKSCQKAVTLAAAIYKVLGASQAIEFFGHHDGDTLLPQTMEVADEWFDRWI